MKYNVMKRRVFVHVTQSVSRLAGGLFESVRHLSESVRSSADEATLVILGPHDEKATEDKGRWAPLEVRTHPVYGPPGFGFARGLTTDLVALKPDLVHLHGLWRYNSVAVLRWAINARKPYVVSPHGMLEPWALQQSRLKKQFATLFYQGPSLRHAACIRATAQQELESVRQAGYRNPVAVVPNGVELPPLPLPRLPRTHGSPRRALFLSRIHPKKGLLNLVEAWQAVRPAGWELLIVGPDECGHLAEVQAAVRERGLEREIIFPGEVWGEARTRLYCSADLFVLPSFSENFGLVIAEALSCEVPVITTWATPWRELETHRCGWWIDIGVEPLIQAFRSAFAVAPEALHEMGARGRKLVEENYAWGPIGKQMLEVYAWMLGKGERPECVHL